MRFIESVSFPYFTVSRIINNAAASSTAAYTLQKSIIALRDSTFLLHISRTMNRSAGASLGEIYAEAFAGQSFREQCFDDRAEEGIISKRNGAKLNCQSQNMGRDLSSRWKWQRTVCLVEVVQTHLFGVMGLFVSPCMSGFMFYFVSEEEGSDLYHKET